jgi:hypothetical protein
MGSWWLFRASLCSRFTGLHFAFLGCFGFVVVKMKVKLKNQQTQIRRFKLKYTVLLRCYSKKYISLLQQAKNHLLFDI